MFSSFRHLKCHIEAKAGVEPVSQPAQHPLDEDTYLADMMGL